MRVIVEVWGRAYVLQLMQGKVVTAEDSEDEFEHAPVDPHSTGGCLVEHASQGSTEVQGLSGSGVYPAQDRKFGFHGS